MPATFYRTGPSTNQVTLTHGNKVIYLTYSNVGNTRQITYKEDPSGTTNPPTFINSPSINSYDPSITPWVEVVVLAGTATVYSQKKKHSDMPGQGEE